MQPKVPIVNAPKKNCIKLIFLQKTRLVRVFISFRNVAGAHQRFAIFEIVHWNGNVYLGTLKLSAAKSTDYIEKCFNQKLSKVKFPTKPY